MRLILSQKFRRIFEKGKEMERGEKRMKDIEEKRKKRQEEKGRRRKREKD
jgi:hypothetical protein